MKLSKTKDYGRDADSIWWSAGALSRMHPREEVHAFQSGRRTAGEDARKTGDYACLRPMRIGT